LGARLEFRGETRQRDFIAANVIGIKRGYDKDLQDRYIILSAHYDHLGIGPPVDGDSVYNGVLDNAIGVAGLLEITRYMAENDVQTKRSVIFIFLTGEEKGLLGSTYYTDHPVIPLYKTDADINIDGLAFIDVSPSAIGIGHKYSDIEKHLEIVLSEMNYTLEGIPPEFNEWESFLRSDQMAFAKAGIPSVLIAEGTQYLNISYAEGINRLVNYFQNIYHTPFDDLNQDINFEATKNHLQIIYALCYRLANYEDEINWKSGSPFINARLRSIAEKK
jgi:Zn-dependent M28 family amino/carboxypeptidase